MRRAAEEMSKLDVEIRKLYETGLGCRAVGARLREHPALVFKRVRKMGILRTGEEALQVDVPKAALEFGRSPRADTLRRGALATAIQWFMARDYMACVPLEPTVYDLIVESDSGLKKVQVKSTTSKEDSGRWKVGIARLEYDGATQANSNGRRVRKAYADHEVDLFFIVTGEGSTFLIPVEVVAGKKSLVLDEKYSQFKV